jgi:anthranilate synthase component 2
MVLLIDNYDSFTFNLAHRLGELGAAVKVLRNDAITVAEIERLAPERLVISPGPGRPETAGVTIDALRHFSGKLPVLGVCLGVRPCRSPSAAGSSVQLRRCTARFRG